jgi:DNA mismatch repair protein MutS
VAVDGDPSGEGDVTFLRTVREGPTGRSYGIHVADMAGVPEPVVDRSQAVLDRLREDKAIEVQGANAGDGGGTTQAVFDLSSGQFDASADGGEADDGRDPETEAVLDELRELDVTETPPVELMAKVQSWQDDLDGT